MLRTQKHILMKSDCKLLYYDLDDYRRSFLKRKNINGWRKNITGTPIIIDKVLNSFDRKIKGIPLFPEDVKIEYFKGLNDIFEKYYNEMKYNNIIQELDCYYNYLAEHFKSTGKGRGLKNNLAELMHLSNSLNWFM